MLALLFTNQEQSRMQTRPALERLLSGAGRGAGRVWCEEGQHPRQVLAVQGGGPGSAVARCACFGSTLFSNQRRLYPGCDAGAPACAIGAA